MLFGGALAAGAIAGHDGPTLFAVIVAGTLGYLAGSVGGWALGRAGGRPLIDRYGRWLHIGPSRFARAERWFTRYGASFVLFGRLLPLVRSFVSIPAGVLEYPLARYALLTAIASVVWCVAFATTGHALGSNWESVHHAFRYSTTSPSPRASPSPRSSWCASGGSTDAPDQLRSGTRSVDAEDRDARLGWLLVIGTIGAAGLGDGNSAARHRRQAAARGAQRRRLPPRSRPPPSRRSRAPPSCAARPAVRTTTAYHAHIKLGGTEQVVLVNDKFEATAVQGADKGRGGGNGRGGGKGHGGHGNETPLTGDTKSKVEAAVLAKYPGAAIVRTETNDAPAAPYESHIKTSTGTEFEVTVSKDFNVVDANEHPAHP